jgi:four helix bundle protein
MSATRHEPGHTGYFDFERLDVFQRSLEILEEVRRICANPVRGNADLYDQLRRSAVSITLNIAEASGEFSPKETSAMLLGLIRSHDRN